MSGRSACHLASTQSELRVDEDDTFFFDHPLDHVPGMLLFDAVLRDSHRAIEVPSRIVAASVRFSRFCEKDVPAAVSIHSDAATSSRLSASIEQSGTAVCTGRIEWAPRADRDIRSQGHPWPAPDAADAALVHKRFPANVMVGPLAEVADDKYVATVVPPDRARAETVHSLSLLVEAVRQLGTMVTHVVGDIPLGWQLIVSSIDVRIDGDFSWSEPIQLRCNRKREARGKGGGAAEVLVDSRPIGEIAFDGRAVSAATYERLRRMSRAGA